MRRPVVRLPARSDAAPLTSVWVRDFDEAGAENFAADVAAVRRARQPVLPVIIASPGGDVYPLLAMIDTLAAYEGTVVTIAVGHAMSCGAILFSCGAAGHRYIAPSATLLLHEVTSEAVDGKAEEQRVNLAETRRLNVLLWRHLSRNVGRDMLRQHRDRGGVDWYLTAAEAVKEGLASRVGLPVFEVRQRLDPLLGVEV